jgi:DNA polymerase-3 subunit delta'
VPAFEGIVGQDRAIAMLQATLAAPRHAYLLVGPPNVGKTALAVAWCHALFCRERTGCATCPECRTFLHGNYADFHRWEPAGRSTSIDQVRDIVRQAELAPYRGAYQVHVVFADTLSSAAANCLLKTLEEPPQGTILVLLAQSVADVLPTIVSRCQRVPLNLVGEQAIADWLVAGHGATPEQALVAARRSGGRIGYAATLLTQEETPARLLSSRDPLEALEEADRAAGLPLERQLQVLEDLTLLVRDTMILLQTGREDWVGQPGTARHLRSTGRSLDAWIRILGLLDSSRQRLHAGASAKLTWAVTAHDVVRA